MKKQRAQQKPSKHIRLADLAKIIAELFPPHLAESWDNVGLQIGDPNAKVNRILTCLEVTDSTLDEARRGKCDTIIAHHPLIFRPLKSIVSSRPSERLAVELVRSNINLIVAHTNMDAAPWGTNQVLAEVCGLKPIGPLDPRPLDPNPEASSYKLVVFTPKGHERAVIDAIDRSGGGRIGLYTHCTFRGVGTGTFRGGEGSDPFIGEAGKFEEAEEYRLEAVVPRESREKVLREVLKVHPYEESAYDFYPLATERELAGLGCIALPPTPLTIDQFVEQIKVGIGIDQVRVSGPPKNKIKRVAVCSGSGGSFIGRAASSGAEAYLTGEISYHHGIEAHQRGLAVIEVGHFESERIIAEPLARKLTEIFKSRGLDATARAAKTDFQPFRFI